MHLFLAMNGSALNRQIYIADLSAPRVTAEPRTLDDQSPCTVLLPPFYFLLCKCFEFFILTLVSLKYPKIEQKVLYKPTKSSRLGKSDIISSYIKVHSRNLIFFMLEEIQWQAINLMVKHLRDKEFAVAMLLLNRNRWKICSKYVDSNYIYFIDRIKIKKTKENVTINNIAKDVN